MSFINYKLVDLETLKFNNYGIYSLYRLDNSLSLPTFSWFTGGPFGGARNNYDGFVGCRFTTNSNIKVSQIGRWVITGNTGIHNVKIRTLAGSILANTQINSSGLSSGFCYGNTDVQLPSGQSYYLYSNENNNADFWYDQFTFGVISGAASCDFPAFSSDESVWNLGTNTGMGYVPVNFIYSVN